MTNRYIVGDAPRIYGQFVNLLSGALADPTTISVTYTKSDGTENTLVYGVDPEVVKEAVGRYYVTLPIDQAGRWKYRFAGTGALIAAARNNLFASP